MLLSTFGLARAARPFFAKIDVGLFNGLGACWPTASLVPPMSKTISCGALGAAVAFSLTPPRALLGGRKIDEVPVVFSLRSLF